MALELAFQPSLLSATFIQSDILGFVFKLGNGYINLPKDSFGNAVI
jgi:hypothetical protein